MSKRISITLCLLTILTCIQIDAASSYKHRKLGKIIQEGIRSYHYKPNRIDNHYSKKAYDTYLKALDPNKRFFLEEDIQDLRRYERSIDDEILYGRLHFADLSLAKFRNRVMDVQDFYQSLFTKPFDFTTNDAIETDQKKKRYAKNMIELKEKWRTIAKYQTLTTYITLLSDEKNPSDNETVNLAKEFKFDPKLEEKARNQVKKNLKRSLERVLDQSDDEQLAIYFNALANSFDPHTGYFSPEKKEDFDINLTGKLEGIGAVLREENGFIKVVRVVPGSAAWRQKELKADDLILKVGQGNNAPVLITDMRVQDAVKLIRGKKGTKVMLTVKKPDGQIKMIPIVRDIVVIEDAYAKSSLIIDDKNNQRFGYIYLPSFYRDFKNSRARNSSDDIEKEVKKLKKKGINGLILDLRNNGGGALRDAVKIAGLFIKSGPIVQVEQQHRKKEVLRDRNPQVLYNGPLVILINQYSASASEILAAAMKDYGRAVIIGGPASFGKGTVQTFINLDTGLNLTESYLKPIGSLKLTIQQFYRINGKSTQFKGVRPDIVLPTTIASTDIGERSLDHSLPFRTVTPLQYTKWHSPPNVAKLRRKSRQRVEKSLAFKKIKAYVETIKINQKDTRQTLNLHEVLEKQESLKTESKAIEDLQADHSTISVAAVDPATQDKDKTEEQKEWFDNIKKDLYIAEAVNVIEDMLKQ